MRRRAREVALHLLFEEEYADDPNADDTPERIERYFSVHSDLPRRTRKFMEHLVDGVRRHREDIDDLIVNAGSNWRFERLGRLERNILRIGVFEILFRDEKGEKCPPEIAIDEAVELAKIYCGDKAPAFINGVLDSIASSSGASVGTRNVWNVEADE